MHTNIILKSSFVAAFVSSLHNVDIVVRHRALFVYLIARYTKVLYDLFIYQNQSFKELVTTICTICRKCVIPSQLHYIHTVMVKSIIHYSSSSSASPCAARIDDEYLLICRAVFLAWPHSTRECRNISLEQCRPEICFFQYTDVCRFRFSGIKHHIKRHSFQSYVFGHIYCSRYPIGFAVMQLMQLL